MTWAGTRLRSVGSKVALTGDIKLSVVILIDNLSGLVELFWEF